MIRAAWRSATPAAAGVVMSATIRSPRIQTARTGASAAHATLSSAARLQGRSFIYLSGGRTSVT
jgi:hypothetical protein